MANPDFRQLCAEMEALLGALAFRHLDIASRDEAEHDLAHAVATLCERARAALAAPQQGAPSDLDLMDAYWKGAGLVDVGTGGHILAGIRAVLTRYAAQAVPVPVADRPWEREGWCDAGGNCWLHDGFAWRLLVVPNGWTKFRPFTHSLPHWALPLPEAQP